MPIFDCAQWHLFINRFLSASSELKSNRISVTSSTDEEIATGAAGAASVDQLVVAQVHHDPIPEQEEIPLPPSSPTTVNEPPKGLYKITCRHKISN